ncbi:hypothetical protein [Streptomyces sp. AP-93]|uniref:hypothetical protein n=1 Tax=Streptomyces sp. AP-93 TaxID=2929048 RepID=UPI001FAE9B94|nr:hypothetical protein [Streptomyces sp. AP-93]MCJ0875374.1 hypothetical protein [Streptomyces sp. AP-93]
MSLSVHRRQKIAEDVAESLLEAGQAEEVWLEGALACGLAHATSDVDLRVIVSGASERWESKIVDGVRVDFQASSRNEVERLRALLTAFDVRRDHLDTFRRVRGARGELLRLRTALAYDGGAWHPVLTEDECAGYRRWALADQAEVAASLAEDLVGLLLDRLTAPIQVTVQKFELCLLALHCAASGQPVLGDKWLPLVATLSETSLPSPALAPSTRDWAWFRPAQRILTEALLSCWPVHCAPGTPPDLGDPFAGWLPQRYADGWFLRRGDVHVPVTEPALLGWCAAIDAADS